MHVIIRETKKVPLKRPIIIEGFPGIGMVGNICASYLAENLKMDLVGSIYSSRFPPISAIHDYKPVSPARIYASKKHNLIVLFSEFVIPGETVYGLSNAILDLAKTKKASALYSLAAIANPEPNDTIYGIASTDRMSGLLKKNGVELIREGATQGVSGVLIAECAARGVDAANLLVQSGAPLDPRASSRLLQKVAAVTKLPVNTTDLIKQADSIEKRVRDSMEKVKDMHANYKEFEQNPMYG